MQGTSIEDNHYTIECTNTHTGDGVECIRVGSIWVNTAGNDLVKYINSMLPSYRPPEIAVLLDNLESTETICQCRHLLEELMPGITFQSAADFPRRGIVVDSVDTFLGLDASLCIFIHPSTSGDVESARSLANPQYRVFLASRATHKAVFMVPQINATLAEQMKFDHFPVSKDSL